MRTQLLASALLLAASPSFAIPATHGLDRRSPPTRLAPGPYPQTLAEQLTNTTTPGASPNGTVGVVLSPDLIPGAPATPGSTNVKFRYGPYTIGSGQILDQDVEKPDQPCASIAGGCYVTALQAGLEYANGTKANVDTGAWLHHMVLATFGTGQVDVVCGESAGGKRMFASGNERQVVRFNGNEAYGLDLGGNGTGVDLSMELMNMADAEIQVYLTMVYEIIPKSTAGYKAVTPIWLDVGGCEGDADVPALAGIYSYTSPLWPSTVNGKLLFSIGHEHDGGTDVELFLNGTLICVNKQLYGSRRPGYLTPNSTTENSSGMSGMGMSSGGGDEKMEDGVPSTGYEHISDAGECVDYGDVSEGDELWIRANYDADVHPEMVVDGELHPVMGISLVYIGT